MPDWSLLSQRLLPPLRSLPPEKSRRIKALAQFLSQLETQVHRDAATGGATLQKTTLALLGNSPTHPDHGEILQAANEASVSQSDLAEILDGIQLELSQRRFRDMTQLLQYARKRVGIPLALGLEILGFDRESARIHGKKGGELVTLLAVLAFVSHDLDHGRILLPQHLLSEHSLTEVDLVAGRATPGMESLASDLIGKANQFLKELDFHDIDLPNDGSRPFLMEIRTRLEVLLRILGERGGDLTKPILQPPSSSLTQRLARLLGRK